MKAEALSQVLRDVPLPVDPNLIVGLRTHDDAAVYRIGPEQAVVFTVDCLTPIHDDPFIFGQIAAANCLSDTWAMGGRPILAINVCGFPQRDLPLEVLTDILRGGAATAAEAGVPVAGGHTMNNREPYYGMAVLGLVHPERLVTNAGARPGDQLVLTKPLGTGVVVTAMINDEAREEHVAAATANMTALNKDAAAVMVELGATAATDITGFGFIGHAHEMAEASRVEFRLRWNTLPVLPGALEYAEAGFVAPGGADNHRHYGQWTDFGSGSPAQIGLLCDPQTSGGLLIAFPSAVLEAALAAMAQRGVQAVHVGEVVPGQAGRLLIQ